MNVAGQPRHSRAKTLWYASYGSNMSPERLSRYVDADSETLAQSSRWLVGEGRLYAAGRSKKWEGAVLFVARSATEQSYTAYMTSPWRTS